jgi:hypothetical protein
MPPISGLTNLLAGVGFSEVAIETVVRRKQLQLDEMVEMVRRDVADRYPLRRRR